MPKRRVYEYCYLYKVAKQNLEMAEQSEEGQFYRLITCLGFCAFLLESVMNEIGDALIDEWMTEHERDSPGEKRKVIHRTLGMVDASGRKPFQAFSDVFAARDLLVHAKPQRLDGDGPRSDESLARKYALPETAIEELATVDNVRRIFSDTQAMIAEWVGALPPDTHFGLQFPSGPFEVTSHG